MISVALAPGELVKDGFFTLFESVGALEVLYDPAVQPMSTTHVWSQATAMSASALMLMASCR